MAVRRVGVGGERSRGEGGAGTRAAMVGGQRSAGQGAGYLFPSFGMGVTCGGGSEPRSVEAWLGWAPGGGPSGARCPAPCMRFTPALIAERRSTVRTVLRKRTTSNGLRRREVGLDNRGVDVGRLVWTDEEHDVQVRREPAELLGQVREAAYLPVHHRARSGAAGRHLEAHLGRAHRDEHALGLGERILGREVRFGIHIDDEHHRHGHGFAGTLPLSLAGSRWCQLRVTDG